MSRAASTPLFAARLGATACRSVAPIRVPIALLLLVSLIVRFSDLDRVWERQFWSPENGVWTFASHWLVQVLYKYGPWPAIVVGAGGAAVWIASIAFNRWNRARPMSLFLALLLAFGPGLVVNSVLKDHFGRPRPMQSKEFGGSETFRPLGKLGSTNAGKSFPSGHASVGFYWVGLFVCFWSTRRGWAWGFLLLGLAHGTVMGLGRMAQGSHWPSDILWSAGFIYLIAWGLHCALFRKVHTATSSPVFNESVLREPVGPSLSHHSALAQRSDDSL